MKPPTSPSLLALLKPQLAPALCRYLQAMPAAQAAGELLPHLEELVPPTLQLDAAELLVELGGRLARRAQARARAEGRGAR